MELMSRRGTYSVTYVPTQVLPHLRSTPAPVALAGYWWKAKGGRHLRHGRVSAPWSSGGECVPKVCRTVPFDWW